MTPNLLRSVAAASLCAALIPAQDVHDVIVRTKKVDGTKVSKKTSAKDAATHKKMMKLIERMGSDDVSSAERKKLKATLLKMLSHKTGDVYFYSTKKPTATKSKPEAATAEVWAWVDDDGKVHSKKATKGKVDLLYKASDKPHVAWLDVAKAGDAKGLWVTRGEKAHAVEVHKLDGKKDVFWTAQEPKQKGRIVRLNKGKKIDAIVDKPSKGKNGYLLEWHKANGEQGKAKDAKKKATWVTLTPEVTELRGRLVDPGDGHEVVTVIEGRDAPVVHYHKAGDAKSNKPRAITYEVADDNGVHVFYSDAKGIDKKAGKLVKAYRYHKQDPKKSKKKSSDEVQITVRGVDGKLHSYRGTDKDDLGKKVQYLIQGRDGSSKKKAKKSQRKAYSFEWVADEGESKKKGKDRGFFTFETDVDLKFDGTKAKADKKGRFSFDVGDLKVNSVKKAKKPGEVSFEVVVEAEDEQKGRSALLKLLNSDGGDAKEGALLKLLSKDDRIMRVAKTPKGGMWATVVVEDEKGEKKAGKWLAEISKDSLVKHLHAEHEPEEIEVVVEEIHGHEHGEHGHEHGDGEVVEMIQELRAEMRELRKMMAEIKKSLAKKAAPKARMLPTLIREESAEPRRRVRRRETR